MVLELPFENCNTATLQRTARSWTVAYRDVSYTLQIGT